MSESDNVNEKQLLWAKVGGDQAENGVKEISVSDGPNDKSKCSLHLGWSCTVQFRENQSTVTKSTSKYFLKPLKKF